jgi:acetylornithine/N-succinyldiaminopimelate aminotransferase
VLRFVPPLTLSDAELAEGLQRLTRALRDFAAAT